MSEGYVCDSCNVAQHGEVYITLRGDYGFYEWCEECYSKFDVWKNKQRAEQP